MQGLDICDAAGFGGLGLTGVGKGSGGDHAGIGRTGISGGGWGSGCFGADGVRFGGDSMH